MIERYSRPEMKKVWSDENKFAKWLQIEIAVAEAWAELGVVPKEALPKIRGASCNLARISEIFETTRHDVTAFLAAVAETVGEESRFIHLGLTSSDIMDTALSLQLIEAVAILEKDIRDFTAVLKAKAIEYKDTPIMGRTHGVHAEPTTFGLKLALWYEEMKRNWKRLQQAKKAISVGKISGVVGTYSTLSPELEYKACVKLQLQPAPISNQVLQRDRHAQFVATLAIIAGSLEKFATEIRGLQKTEVREVEEPFAAGQTGSSAMPHKRNPELSERVCGLARIIRGHSLTAMENIALWHERDISHSSTERIILPDACLALDYMFDRFTYVMRGLRVYPDSMIRNIGATKGLIFSQRVLTLLIEKKGIARQEAYEIVQRNAAKVWEQGSDFYDLLVRDSAALLSEEDLQKIFDPNYSYYLRYVNSIFQRLGLLKKYQREEV